MQVNIRAVNIGGGDFANHFMTISCPIEKSLPIFDLYSIKVKIKKFPEPFTLLRFSQIVLPNVTKYSACRPQTPS